MSDVLDIEVFDSVEIYPQDLLLTPTMSYTVSVRGGPQSYSNKISHCYSSQDDKIANVNKEKTYAFEIDAHRIGDVKITYTIIEGSDCQSEN